MISTVTIPNIIAIILIMLLLYSTASVSRHKPLIDTKLFLIMLICNLFQCLAEITAYAIDGKMITGFHTFALVLNSLLFVVNIFFAFIWTVYADYKIYESVERTMTAAKRTAIPAIIVTVGAIINLFTPVFFRITDDNVYQRTSLFILPYILTYAYLLHGTVFIYRHKNRARKYVFMPAILFMIPILLGSILQFCFYGISTTWVGVSIALVAVYINMQNEVSYTDPLSGLYTRVYMYHYLQNALVRRSDDTKIAGIMLDIDNFKMINDTYGHLMGDAAIRTVGKILHRILPSDCIAARYGGDEFVVLREITSEAEILETIGMITQAESNFKLSNDSEYTLHFSNGYAIMDPSVDDVDTFLERMDRAMYEAKKSSSGRNTV